MTDPLKLSHYTRIMGGRPVTADRGTVWYPGEVETVVRRCRTELTPSARLANT